MYHPSPLPNIYPSNHPQLQHSDPNQPFQAYNSSSIDNYNNNNNKTSQKIYSASIPSVSSSPITNISSELSTAKMKLSVNQGLCDPLATGSKGGDDALQQQQFLSQQSSALQQQQQPQQSTSLPQSSTFTSSKDMSLPVIQRVEALDVIIHFKKHLQDKWKKNRAKQHVNKIIHYHVQHTFFLRYAAPLFLQDYQELLQSNLAKEGPNQTSNGREQGLLATLKQINTDVLNGSKKTKSIGVLDAYLSKLEEKQQLSEFLEVLVYILFGEAPCQIPAELNERKKNLFHYVSPIIGFLIIFYIHAEKKPLTLDELVTRSGLKQLYKSVEVSAKDFANTDSKNGNDSEDDSEDDQMMEEDDNSIPQANSQPLNIHNNSSPPQQQQQQQQQQQLYPLQQMSEKGDMSDDKQFSRTTSQFQNLEKTLYQQKQQQQQQQQKQLLRQPIGEINNISQHQPIQQTYTAGKYNLQQQLEMQAAAAAGGTGTNSKQSASPSFLMNQQQQQQQQQQHQTQKQQQFVGNRPNISQQQSSTSPSSQTQQISNIIQSHGGQQQVSIKTSQIYSSSTPTKSSQNNNNHSNNSNSNSSTQHYHYQTESEQNMPQPFQQQQQQYMMSSQVRQDQYHEGAISQQHSAGSSSSSSMQNPSRSMSFQNMLGHSSIHQNIHNLTQQQHGAANLSSTNNTKYFKQLQGNQAVSIGVDASSLQPRRA